jgi:hypothetical protein
MDAVGEGGGGGDPCSLDGAKEVIKAKFRLAPIRAAVNRPERFLERLGLGDQRLALEQLAELPTLAR